MASPKRIPEYARTSEKRADAGNPYSLVKLYARATTHAIDSIVFEC